VFETVVLLLATAVGYGTGSYWSAVFPTAALAAAVFNYAINPPSDLYRDEVNVWPGALIVLSAIAVIVCLAAAALGRRVHQRR
jgi:hypothetical protein